MKRTIATLAMLLCASNLLAADGKKDFPAGWGNPPTIQTQDYVELPGGYGRGSSTLARWIAANLEKDKAGQKEASSAKLEALYANDFETTEPGSVPDEFMVLNGDFAVKAEGGNRFLELPGAPLDSFGVQFGPTEREGLAVSARVFGTARGRRAPTFGVGLGGVSGFKLQVSPGKQALELLKDMEVKADTPFDWKAGTWTQLRLQLRKVKDGAWRIEGKAWPQGEPEPRDWALVFDEKEEPVQGRASILGSPFAGTPIWFDDLRVARVAQE